MAEESPKIFLSPSNKIGRVEIGLASPETILQWSKGEVKKPETINYRTFKPEPDGLFSEQIFGPVKDYECACGRYKGKKYEGTTCERCGVTVESKTARRRRMGHISLAVPVVHIWYLKNIPNYISILLDISPKDIEQIVYFGSRRTVETVYMVTDPKNTNFDVGDKLYATEYNIYKDKLDFVVENSVRIKSPRGPIRSEIDGIVSIKKEKTNTDRFLTWVTVSQSTRAENSKSESYTIYRGMELNVKNGEIVKKGDLIANELKVEPFKAPFDGTCEIDEVTSTIRVIPLPTSKFQPVAYTLPYGVKPTVQNGQKVKKGKVLTSSAHFDAIRAGMDGVIVYGKNLSVSQKEDEKLVANSTDKIEIVEKDQVQRIERSYPLFEGITPYVEDGQEIKSGDYIADRFVYEDEDLTVSELDIFEKHYPGQFEKEFEIENDRTVVMITDIADDVAAEIGKKVGDVILDNEYDAYKDIYGDKILADVGASAIKKLLQKIDLGETESKLEAELKSIPDSASNKKMKILKRLHIIRSLIESNQRPEWMVLDVVPVIPPDLRPMIQIDGGRFATTDLNDLYRRVINRNNRLKKLIELNAPDIIIRNEKRMLQEAVDSLIANGKRGKSVMDKSNRPLKSLTDLLKGKRGRFRRNLLGKRVDYSGRAVIVVGPTLRIDQCGIPKKMAMELFKPFVLQKLVKSDPDKSARKWGRLMIEREVPEAWEVLEDVIKGHPVLLNRAPTLHRVSIQAFEPKLIEGDAIQLHPLVCPPFNADFDGDQMAVHIPLSAAAQAEAKFLMLSKYNTISPANGQPLSMPGKDIILGMYYLTMKDDKLPKYKTVFSSAQEAILAYEMGYITLHTPIDVMMKFSSGEKLVKDTTVGRVIFNEGLFEELRDYTKTYDKKEIKNIVSKSFKRFDIDVTAEVLDRIKDFGFKYSTISGVTISVRDVLISNKKYEIIRQSQEKIQIVEDAFENGLINQQQRYEQIVRIWEDATKEIQDVTYAELSKDLFNPVFMMVRSGARGSIDQIKQIAGMRGLMADPSGKTIEVPILSNFREGLNVMEYFISTHGARKGSADTALRTSNSGYLTRRLVDVAQSVTVKETDCGTTNGIELKTLRDDDVVIEKLEDSLFGRVLAEDIVNPKTKEVIYERDTMMEEEDAHKAVGTIEEVEVYRQEEIGVDSINDVKDYAEIAEDLYDDEKGTFSGVPSKLIFKKGEPIKNTVNALKKLGVSKVLVDIYPCVGGVTVSPVVAADGKREVATYEERVTPEIAKKFVREHIDTVSLRPYIKIRSPMTCELSNGVCEKCYGMDLSNHRIVHIGEAIGIIAAQSIGEPGTQLTMRTFHTGGIATTGDITQGLPRAEELFEARKKLKDVSGIFSHVSGYVKQIKQEENKTLKIYIEDDDGNLHDYTVPKKTQVRVREGQRVLAGTPLTTGTIRPRDLLEKVSTESSFQYLLREVKRVYAEQGVDIHDKHFEVIIKQMFNKVEVTDAGDTNILPGTLLSLEEAKRINEEIRKENSRVEENRSKIVGKELVYSVSSLDEKNEEIAKAGDILTEEMVAKMVDKGIKSVTVKIGDKKERYIINPKNEIQYKQKLLRITTASLESEGFLSAASFQQTPQILAEAAVEGRGDMLKGLKENVIIGQLIPSGTGLSVYNNLQIEEHAIAKSKEEIKKEQQA
ncbi:DNA-directed RNA polymerase subunit beta' [Athalassotoga saccharophila]|uniref:DNA-directed RNA polymerase subunit beta' n=1 Tax=Athalassotoga saccharophila TaxID=1441386 RepID=UPI00137A2B0B|nr:DNA-directed RNA polymerase subunit beta' [Athalassotoga saccharophila]